MYGSACVFAALALITLAGAQGTSQNTFHERLVLRTRESGHLHVHFLFSLATSAPTSALVAHNSPHVTLQETTTFPPALLELVERFGVENLTFSLGRGRWDAERWGWVPPASDLGRFGNASLGEGDWKYDAKPRGAEVSATLRRNGGSDQRDPLSQSLDDDIAIGSWKGLTNSLAGAFCASLSSLARSSAFSTTADDDPQYRSFHGLLPLEHPCTENLTPLLRLLPCGGRAGLAQLLGPHRLAEADWQRLGITLKRRKDGIHGDGLQAWVEVEAVLDPVRRDKSAGRFGSRDWSFYSMLDRRVERLCPVATSSTVRVSDHASSLVEPFGVAARSPDKKWHTFDVMQMPLPMDIAQKWLGEQSFPYPEAYAVPPLSISRLLTANRLGLQIQNNRHRPVEVWVAERLPWWLKVWGHTRRLTMKGLLHDPLILERNYIASIPRQRLSRLTHRIRVPPMSLIELSFEFSTSPLRYTEYPSDAHRGFDVPPASVTITDNQDGWEAWAGRRIWTTGTLIDVPTPDFSMPYNVIIVTSTVIALFFGSLFNLVVRQFTIVKGFSSGGVRATQPQVTN